MPATPKVGPIYAANLTSQCLVTPCVLLMLCYLLIAVSITCALISKEIQAALQGPFSKPGMVIHIFLYVKTAVYQGFMSRKLRISKNSCFVRFSFFRLLISLKDKIILEYPIRLNMSKGKTIIDQLGNRVV